jgi:SAM-dependent methyltransferase
MDGGSEHMKEIDANKNAWNQLSKDHYHHFKERLEKEDTLLNEHIIKELGDISSKTLLHLQCNTGADTLSLARLGLSFVTGVDLSDQNIYYANKLKDDFQMNQVQFIESNVLTLSDIHQKTYDIVFTSEGVLGWLPDLKAWAKVIFEHLNEGGFFYIYDSHPFFHMLDQEALIQRSFQHKYDYFDQNADYDEEIGGYASETKHAGNYWWNHKISDILNALIEAGLRIEYMHEFDTLFWNNGDMTEVKKGLYQYPEFKNKMPFSYSIKAIKK